jgi:hypothetical protein
MFVFASESGHYSEEWARIVVLNEHRSMTVRDVASVVDVGKLSVSRIPCA